MIFLDPKVFLLKEEIILTFVDGRHSYKVSYHYNNLSELTKIIIGTIRLAQATGKKIDLVGEFIDQPGWEKSFSIRSAAIAE